MYENCVKDLEHNIKELKGICRDKIHFTNTDILLEMFTSLSKIFSSNGRKEITENTIKGFLTKYELPQSFDPSNIENSQRCLKLNVFNETHSSIVNKIYDHVFKVSANLFKVTNFMGETSGFLGMFKSPNGVVTIKSGLISAGYIKNLVQNYTEEEVKSVIVKNQHTFFINEDLVLNGKNLVISSSLWEIKGKHKIDLSGINGDNHYPYKANNGASAGDDGIDGLPGKPGQHSGHFYGQGKKIISYSPDSKLIVKLNGGDGGNGQDGGNGRNGLNGRDATDSFFNPERRHSSIIEEGLTENKVLVTYTKDGTYGTSGGNAGKGGLGGLSGYKGIGKLKFTDTSYSNILTLETYNGNKGQDGSKGTVGRGGRNGDDLVSERIEYETNSFSKSLSKQMGPNDQASLPIVIDTTKQMSSQDAKNLAFSIGFIGTLALDVVTLRPVQGVVNCFQNKDWNFKDKIKNNGYKSDGKSPSELNNKSINSYPDNPYNLTEAIETLGDVIIPDDYNI